MPSTPSDDEKAEKKRAVRAACARSLSYHDERSPRATLEELAAFVPEDAAQDDYGEGPLIEGFEREIAELLGKPAALFLPSGTMAQQIAARIWADRKGIRTIGFHPTCHLEIHERKGYSALHGLQGVTIGHRATPMKRSDLDKTADRLAALVIELPQREIGGLLPSWDDLVDLTSAARNRGAAVHMDGARLWESGPYYARPYRDIAALFDSVYVSFYKGIGGIAGAALAGDADFIAEAKVWQRRHGGNLVALYPYVIAAKLGLAKRLDKMPLYHQRAIEIARALAAVPGIEVVPATPHTNMMHVYVRGDRDRIEASAFDVSAETKVWILRGLIPTPIPDLSYFELVVGDASFAVEASEAAALVAKVLSRARDVPSP